MLTMLLWVILIIAVGYAVFWFIDNAGVPYPLNMLAKVVIAVICIAAIFERTGLLHGTLT